MKKSIFGLIVLVLLLVGAADVFAQSGVPTSSQLLAQASQLAMNMEKIDTEKEFNSKRTTTALLDKIMQQATDFEVSLKYFHNSGKELNAEEKQKMNNYLYRIEKANKRLLSFLED